MQETGVISSLTSDVAEGHTLPYHAGLMPECTTDPRRAFHLWSSDGAVILRTNRTDAPGMLAGARDAFGPRILFCQSPTTMATDTCVGSALEPRIDGCLTFGDYYPDLVFLLCERQATAGGGAFLVDGQRLIHAIASDPAQRPLIRFLWDVKLEQSRPDGGCPARTGKPVSSRRPVVSRTCGGRLTVRRHPHQRLRDDGPARPDDRQHLAAWHDSPRRPPEARRGSCSTLGTCSAWTTTGSSTASSPTPGMTGSCTRCGPGATWPSAYPIQSIWHSPQHRHHHGAIQRNGLLTRHAVSGGD